MILDDFVLLGTTVPESTKDGRVVRCSAGYSLERRSLIRLYPLSPTGGLHRWDQFRLALEVNTKDNRHESYKLAGNREDQIAIDGLTRGMVGEGRIHQISRQLRLEQVDRFKVPSIDYLNQQRRSLGIIEPEIISWSYEIDPAADRAQQQFDGLESPPPEMGRRAYPARPRIQFVDADGKHDLAFNGHDAYEYMRKHPEASRASLFDGLRWEQDRDVRLLVGNLNHQRTAWCVIAYLDFARAQPSLFNGRNA